MKKIISVFMSLLITVSCLTVIGTINAGATQSRSYNFNRNYSITGSGAQDIVNVAKAQLGKTKAQLGYTEAWCADFVGDCASLAGIGDRIPAAGYCGTLYNNIKNAGGYEVSSPQLGDIVFYYCTASYCPNSGKPWVHVGIMVDSVNSIEGNYGGKVSSVSGHYRDCNNHTTGAGVVVRKYLRPNYGNPACSCSGSYAGDYIVTTSSQPLTMRAGHGTGYSVITSIPKGSKVYVSKANGSWAHVEWNGYRGYCAMQYLTKVQKINPPSGYNISISNNSFYDNEISTITINPYDSNITNYKLHFVTPDGRRSDPDLGSKNVFSFCCRGVYGTWKVYAEITNDGGTFCGSTSNGCLSFNINRVNLGNSINLGSDFYAQIGNACSNKVLTHCSFSNYTNVYMGNNTNSNSQIFRFVRQSDGSYIIKSRKNSNYCLDVYNNGFKSGTNVGVYPDNGTNAQKWKIYSAGNGYYYFRPIDYNSALLDVEGGSSNNGANVQLWTYNTTAAQKFSIIKMGSASLNISKTSLTFDLANNPTSTITVSAKGLLPNSYNFSANRDPNAFTTKWSNWEGNSCNYTITAKKIGNYKIDFKLKDVTSNDTVLDTKTIPVVVKCSHKFTSKVVSPTTLSNGFTLHTCSVCGYNYKDNYTEKKQIVPTSISLNRSSITLNVGGSYTLTKTVYPSNATTTFTWTSSNATVASVSNGKITAKKAGTATITVKTSNGKTATCKVTVNPVYPTSISLNRSLITLGVGESCTLTKTITPTNANQSCTWTSSNLAVVSVSDGRITAKKAGTATITVKTSNGKSTTCKVTVKPAPTSVKVSISSLTLGKGDIQSISAITNSGSWSTNFTWSSSNTNVAIVTRTTANQAKISAKGEGTTTITVKTYNGKIATCKVTVINVTRVNLDVYSVNIPSNMIYEKESNGDVVIYDKYNYNFNTGSNHHFGRLIYITKYTSKTTYTNTLSVMPSVDLGYHNGAYYIAIYPTDVPYYYDGPDIYRQKYMESYALKEYVVSTIKFKY